MVLTAWKPVAPDTDPEGHFNQNDLRTHVLIGGAPLIREPHAAGESSASSLSIGRAGLNKKPWY